MRRRKSTLASAGKLGRDFTNCVVEARDSLGRALSLLGPKREARKISRRFDQVRSVQLALNVVSSIRRIIPLYDIDDPDLKVYTTQGFDGKIQTLLDEANSSLVELLQVLKEGRDIETVRSERARSDVKKAIHYLREFGDTLDRGIEPQDVEPEPEPKKRRRQRNRVS